MLINYNSLAASTFDDEIINVVTKRRVMKGLLLIQGNFSFIAYCHFFLNNFRIKKNISKTNLIRQGGDVYSRKYARRVTRKYTLHRFIISNKKRNKKIGEAPLMGLAANLKRWWNCGIILWVSMQIIKLRWGINFFSFSISFFFAFLQF